MVKSEAVANSVAVAVGTADVRGAKVGQRTRLRVWAAWPEIFGLRRWGRPCPKTGIVHKTATRPNSSLPSFSQIAAIILIFSYRLYVRRKKSEVVLFGGYFH